MANTPNPEGIGTKRTGFAEEHYGPFKCGNCVWMRPGGTCANSLVHNDPQVPRTPDGKPKVDEEDCCNKFRSQRMNIGSMIQKAMVNENGGE